MIVFEDAYLTESQRLANADFLEFDATLAKYDTLYEAVNGEFRANLSLAEAKVFRECGTEDDLVTLYEAADADANKKKGNILARAFKAIADFLRKIVEKVKNAFSRNKKENITVPKSTADTIKYIIGEGKAKINELINALNGMNTFAKIAAATIPAAAISEYMTKHKNNDEATAIVAATDGEKAASLLGKLSLAINKAADNIPNAFNNKTGNESSDDEEKANGLRGLLSKISKFFAKILTIIMNALFNKDNAGDSNDKGTERLDGEEPLYLITHSGDQGNGKNTSESVYDYIFDDSNYTVESQDDYSACMNYLDTLIADL